MYYDRIGQWMLSLMSKRKFQLEREASLSSLSSLRHKLSERNVPLMIFLGTQNPGDSDVLHLRIVGLNIRFLFLKILIKIHLNYHLSCWSIPKYVSLYSFLYFYFILWLTIINVNIFHATVNHTITNLSLSSFYPKFY